MPYINGVRVTLAEWRKQNPPKALSNLFGDEDEPVPEPDVPVAEPVRRKRATTKAKAAAAVATGVKLPDGIQLPEDGIVPPVAQANTQSTHLHDADLVLDEEEESE